MTLDLQEHGAAVTVVIDGIRDVELHELERIKQQDTDGLLHPEAVVAAASSASSPLHHRFEWDDSEAGRKFRLAQARALIKCVHVTYPDMTPVRYYPHVRSDRRGYRRVTEVLHIEQLKQSYLHQFSTDIQTLINKYQAFAELSGEVKDLTKVLSRVQKKIKPAKKAA